MTPATGIISWSLANVAYGGCGEPGCLQILAATLRAMGLYRVLTSPAQSQIGIQCLGGGVDLMW